MIYTAILSSPSNAINKDGEAAALQEGCAVEFVLPKGILIKGLRRQLIRLEKKGYRVKLLLDTNLLEIGDYKINTNRVKSEEILKEVDENWAHYLVQLIAPPLPQWIQELEQHGVDVVEPVCSYGLFVVCDKKQIQYAAELPYVAWVGPFMPVYRIHRGLYHLSGNVTYLSIAVYPPHKMSDVIKVVTDNGGSVVRETYPDRIFRGQYGELLVEGEASLIGLLAELPVVRWLEYAPPHPGLESEREAQIAAGNIDNRPHPHKAPLPGYTGWLQGLGLTGGSGVKIAICDTGVDANRETNRLGHADLRQRQYSFVDYREYSEGNECVLHGTHVTAIAVGAGKTGQKDVDGFLWGQGMAPKAEYIDQNILSGPWPPDWATVVWDAKVRGADLINNSWCAGSNSGDGYSLVARTFDRLVIDAVPGYALPCPVTIIFSAGNTGPEPSSITPPKEAKNVIVVGNSLGYQPYRRFRCSDIRGVFGTSSRGPARDGRILPTIVAPGTDVAAALALGSRRTPIAEIGQTDPENPSCEQSQYVYMTGTSMSAALVSGACAVIIEWWRNATGGGNPSPALIKALLINGAEDQAGGQDWRCLNGAKQTNETWVDLDDGRYCRSLDYLPVLVVSGFQKLTHREDKDLLRGGEWHYCTQERMFYVRTFGSTSPALHDAPLLSALVPQPLGFLPDYTQGWGRINLNNIFFQSPAANRGKKTVIDGEYAFTYSGEEFVIDVSPVDTKLPMRITLVWTDPPAAVGSGRTLVNDLDLEVQETGGRKRLYKGNALKDGFSRSGADYDSSNNTECVYLCEPQGIYQIRVIASALRSSARPPFDCRERWQDFALVIDNGERVTDSPVHVVPVIEQCREEENSINEITLVCKQLLVSLRNGDGVGLIGVAGDYCPAERAKAYRTVSGKATHKQTSARMLLKQNRYECISRCAGITAASDLLMNLPGKRAILLFSGQRNNSCPFCADTSVPIDKTAKIYTCAIGMQAEHRLLAELAAGSGGEFYYVPKTALLPLICNYIRAEFIGENVVLNKTVKTVKGYSETLALVDEGVREITFVFSWPEVPKKHTYDPRQENELSVRLREPDGCVVHPNSSLHYRDEGPGHIIYKKYRPKAGLWRLVLCTAHDKEMNYTVCAFVQSSLHLQVAVSVRENLYTISADILDHGVPVENFRASITIYAEGVNSVEETTMSKKGLKHFFTYNDKNNKQPYNVAVRADGISPVTGSQFCRFKLMSVLPEELSLN